MRAQDAFSPGLPLGQERPPGKPLPLKVVERNCSTVLRKPVRLRGVNTASLEWSSDGEDGHVLETVKTAITGWHANTIRLPLSQDRWFGKAPEQTDKGKNYRILVRRIVDVVNSAGLLHHPRLALVERR